MKFNSFLIFTFLFLTSCGGEHQDAKDSNTSISVSSVNRNYQQMITDLQGNWERTTYPFGGAEFKGETVKFMEGEGSKTIPKFEKFVLSNRCNSIPQAPHLTQPEAYLVRSIQGLCNKIKLDQDTLFLGGLGRSYSIIYTRAQ